MKNVTGFPIGHSTLCTATTTTAQEPLTVEKIKAALDALGPLMPEPFEAFMKKHGFDPKDGYRMALPENMREKCGPFVPWFVGFMSAAEAPIIYLDPTQWCRKRLVPVIDRTQERK